MASTRIAVVTGTARKAGIGRAVARAFVKQSYKVLGVDRLRPEALEDEDGAFHDAYRHLVVDISQQSEINFLSQEVQKQFGAEARVDVLVNNAGVADPHLPQNDVELVERFNKILAVNLSGRTGLDAMHWLGLAARSTGTHPACPHAWLPAGR